ncbi:MAG: ATP-binding protein [Candidatus Anstonellales archaeon]
MHILPLRFKFIKDFFPGYNAKQLGEVYSILGGIPRYLEEFDSKLSIEENIKRKILDRTSFLYHEPFNLLFEEFRAPAPYASILSAITNGYVKFAEIAEFSKIQTYKLPKYLLILERVGLIEKEIPVTEKKLKAKTTRYKIKDNFYKFWFKFIFKNRSMLEQGLQKEVLNLVKQELNTYTSKSFEDVCKDFLLEMRMFNLTKIGKWWHKDKEIDIVGLNERTREILFAECKWQERVNARIIFTELKEKARCVDWPSKKQTYVIFAKSFKEKFKEPGILLFDLKDMEKFL